MISPERTRAAEVKRALGELDAWLLGAPSRVRGALKRGLGPGAKHTQLHWAASQLGTRIPHDLRALYSWHNGQRGAGTFFARLLDHECADYLVGEPARAHTFLSLAAMVRPGAVAGERRMERALGVGGDAQPAEATATFSFRRSGGGAEATFYLPFAVASVSGDDGDDGDDDDDDDEAYEAGGRTLFLETLGGAVLMWDDQDPDEKYVELVAPSLAELLDRTVASMQAGRIALPSGAPPPRAPRQAVDASARLVQALLEARFLALAATTPASELAEALRPRLAKRRDALGEVTRFLMEDPRVEEIFADEETLERLVAEFVGR